MSEATIIRETDVTTIIEVGETGPPGPPGDVGPPGTTDHGLLAGLTDDDHPQYLTTGRGDARYDALGAAIAAVNALKNGAPAGGDTLSELDARIAVVEALGSLATDAELAALLVQIVNGAPLDSDTFGEMVTLLGLRLLKSANLSDVANAATALGNLGGAPLASPAFTGDPTVPAGNPAGINSIPRKKYVDDAIATQHTADLGTYVPQVGFTESVQDIAGGLLAGDSADLDFTYDDAGNAEGAVIKPAVLSTFMRTVTDDADGPTAQNTLGMGAITYVRGLDGTFTTDMRATIQAVIDSVAASGGGLIQLPYGTFKIGQTTHPRYSGVKCGLILKSNVTLRGAGMGATILKNAASSANSLAPLITNDNRGSETAGDNNITVEDLAIDGNAGNQTQLQEGMLLFRVRKLRVNRVAFYDVYGGTDATAATETFAFGVESSADVRLTDCVAYATDSSFITSTGFGTGYSTDITFVNCSAHDLRNGMGFTTYLDSNVSYVGCHAYKILGAGGINARGFNAELGQDITYSGCIAGSKTPDTSIIGASKVSVFYADATSLGNKNGFIVSGATRVQYNGCVATFNTASGFESLDNSTGPTVSSNVRINGGDFSHNGTYGIRQGNATDFRVSPATRAYGNTTANLSLTTYDNKLDAGESTLHRREVVTSSAALGASGRIQYTFFTAERTETITQIRIRTGGTAAAATPTICRIDICKVESNGDLTRVASTTNDTALFAATFTTYTKALTASFVKQAGQRYAVGVLVVSAGALPTFYGSGIIPDDTQAPRLAGSVSSLSDLPTSPVSGAGLSASGTNIYVALAP